MRGGWSTPAGRWTLGLVSAAVAAVLAVGLGRVLPSQPLIALAVVGAVLALGLTVAEPAAIPLLTMPLLLVVYRVGGAGIGLSVSDLALFLATLVALVFAPRPFSPTLRTLLWLNAVYQFATLFTVIANPYLANTVEWVHAWMLVSGALIVGWTIGRSGHAKRALSLLLVTAMALAVVTIVQGTVQLASGDFSAVYVSWPYGMHKNFVGSLLCFAAIVAFVNPSWLSWGRGLAGFAFWSCAAAVMVSQSRQAIIALGAAIVFVAWRERRVKNRAGLVALGVLPAVGFALTLVQDQVESGNEFNSVFQRLTWFQDTIAAWLQAPWFGYGLRFWYQEASPFRFQPPNAELEVLASAGVLGLGGFAVLIVGTLVVLGRLDPRHGTLAFTLVLTRVIQGQFDLFWTAVQVSVPFAIAGIALGVMAHDTALSRPAAELQRASLQHVSAA